MTDLEHGMTAEVVVMNFNAVAIAADSAVTIQGQKVLNSANKLYMLAPGHAVGVVIFNNSNFMGLSWELIIKLYRNHLQNTRFSGLVDYANDFFTFIETNCESWIPAQAQEEALRKITRLEFLRELVPGAVRMAVLVTATNAEATVRDVEAAARALRLQIQVFNVNTIREIDAAFASFARERPDIGIPQRTLNQNPISLGADS
jgi:hypothetical protein